MEHINKRSVLIGIDGVYIPVSNRKKSEEWYMEHLGLESRGDYLLAGKQEVFLRESLDENRLTFRTSEWLETGESYEMPVVCFRTSDINGIHEHLRTLDIRIGDFIVHNWFTEFDFWDPDGNKLKVWQPIE